MDGVSIVERVFAWGVVTAGGDAGPRGVGRGACGWRACGVLGQQLSARPGTGFRRVWCALARADGAALWLAAGVHVLRGSGASCACTPRWFTPAIGDRQRRCWCYAHVNVWRYKLV